MSRASWENLNERLGVRDLTILEIEMPTQRERRKTARRPCKLVCPFELMRRVDSGRVQWTKGAGHAINRSVKGILLLLPEPVTKHQVVEIQAPSNGRTQRSAKLVEVCWTRPIPVTGRVKMYLAGTRFLFDLPKAC